MASVLGASRLGATLAFDLGGEVAEAGVEGAEEADHRVPANTAPTSLDLRDVGRVDREEVGQRLLREVAVLAEFAKRAAEHELLGFLIAR
jgi:hypothetical protein